ncbi:hypothetical protein WA026_016672 [Henosepilachna vigintioctopunctata]|uniref:Uncharacterized protein n=1 Tax=Henosepilachna vigintioctopunctata TaxID=420089 RepID=A0AAW1V0V8_9CUCU
MDSIINFNNNMKFCLDLLDNQHGFREKKSTAMAFEGMKEVIFTCLDFIKACDNNLDTVMGLRLGMLIIQEYESKYRGIGGPILQILTSTGNRYQTETSSNWCNGEDENQVHTIRSIKVYFRTNYLYFVYLLMIYWTL